MFLGSLPSEAIKVIGNIVKDWKCEKIIVGCSGNFTIERSISSFDNVKSIMSNDVTIYSGTLGKYFVDLPIDLEMRNDYEGKCSFLGDYLEKDVDKVATLILASDVLKYDKGELAYFDRMVEAYKKQFPEFHKQMVTKLEKAKANMKVKEFYYGDVMKLIDVLENSDYGFISFPPFFKGGYEKMWKDLERFFTYDKPEYEEFDPNVHIKLFCEKVAKAKNFVIGTERKVEELEEYFSGVVLTNKGKKIYFYSRSDRKVYLRPKEKYNLLKVERIKPDERIENIKVVKLSHEQFEELRAVYLSKGIKTARESQAYGLFSNDKLFGCFAFSTSPTLINSFNNKLATPVIYEMTDFAISPTCERHLSKLVLMCVLSKEVKEMAENIMGKRVRSIATNAFSKNPVSMKYRGLFDVLCRKVIEQDEEGKPTKYNITYGATAGQWTIQEAFEKWKKGRNK